MTVLSCIATAFPASAGLYKKGDANRDMDINAKDNFAIKQFIVGASSDIDTDASDVNEDRSVNGKDTLIIKSQVAGSMDISSAYPDGCGWEGFTLMGAPIGDYTVVVTNPDNANMVFAADELSKYGNVQ